MTEPPLLEFLLFLLVGIMGVFLIALCLLSLSYTISLLFHRRVEFFRDWGRDATVIARLRREVEMRQRAARQRTDWPREGF